MDEPPAGFLAHFDHLLSYRIARNITVLSRLYRPFDPDIDGPRALQAELIAAAKKSGKAAPDIAAPDIAAAAQDTPASPSPKEDQDKEDHDDPLLRLTDEALPFFLRAGFRKLEWDEIHASSHIATPQGINLLVKPEHYDASMVLVLPHVVGKRKHRPWWALFFKREYKVDLYPRVVLLLKPNAARFKDPDLDTDHVFLRLFRNVPVYDLEMVFPGGKVKLTFLDRLMIYYPLIAGIGLLLYQIIPELMQKPVPHLLTQAVLAVGFYALFKWTVAMALGGWSWRTYSAYRGKMERYGLKLTRNLYLQTMDSNLGVFTRLGVDITQRERDFLAKVVEQVEFGTGVQGSLAAQSDQTLMAKGDFAKASAETIREAGRAVMSNHYQGKDAFLESLVEELITEKEKFDKRATKQA